MFDYSRDPEKDHDAGESSDDHHDDETTLDHAGADGDAETEMADPFRDFDPRRDLDHADGGTDPLALAERRAGDAGRRTPTHASVGQDERIDAAAPDPLAVDREVSAPFDWLTHRELVDPDEEDDGAEGDDTPAPAAVAGTAGTTAADDPVGTDHRGQEVRPSNDHLSNARLEANAPEGDGMAYQAASERMAGTLLDMVPDSMAGAPTVAQETAAAREVEIQKTAARNPHDTRAERTRDAVAEMGVGDADGTPLADLDRDETTTDTSPPDSEAVTVPLGGLDAETQEAAARAAVEILNHDDTDDFYDAVMIQWRLGNRLRRGMDLPTAVLEVAAMVRRPPTCTAVGDLGATSDYRVNVKGEIVTLWEPTHPDIREVGLIEDDGETVKFTVWESACEHGLTSCYGEGGFPRWKEAALRGDLEEGVTVRIDNAKNEQDHLGRPCLEIDDRASM